MRCRSTVLTRRAWCRIDGQGFAVARARLRGVKLPCDARAPVAHRHHHARVASPGTAGLGRAGRRLGRGGRLRRIQLRRRAAGGPEDRTARTASSTAAASTRPCSMPCIGYAVVPRRWRPLSPRRGARPVGQPDRTDDAGALLEDGSFARHVRKARGVYARRRDAAAGASPSRGRRALRVSGTPAFICCGGCRRAGTRGRWSSGPQGRRRRCRTWPSSRARRPARGDRLQRGGRGAATAAGRAAGAAAGRVRG